MTKDQSAEKWYADLASKMTPKYLDQIETYYSDWSGQNILDINFRFIKVLTRRQDNKELQWYFFHQLVNKRRIDNEELPQLLIDIIADGIYPLRMFASCTEWLAPNEVWRTETPRIIRSGFIPFENDADLATSIKTACHLVNIVDNPTLVYTGNKSIHVWTPITIPELSDRELAYADKREKVELAYRNQIFEKVSKKTPFPLDKRVTADTRRVVPIPNSLNALTGRKAIDINPNRICDLTSTKVQEAAEIQGWNSID